MKYTDRLPDRDYTRFLPVYRKIEGKNKKEMFIHILVSLHNMKESSANRRWRELKFYLQHKSDKTIFPKKKAISKKIVIPKQVKRKEVVVKTHPLPKVEVLKPQSITPPILEKPLVKEQPKEILVPSFMEFSPDMIEEPSLQKKMLFKDMINYKMKITKELLLKYGFNGMQINWLLKTGWMKEWKIVKEMEEENQIVVGTASNPTSA